MYTKLDKINAYLFFSCFVLGMINLNILGAFGWFCALGYNLLYKYK